MRHSRDLSLLLLSDEETTNVFGKNKNKMIKGAPSGSILIEIIARETFLR